ncbi:MAG: hypothetical protein ACE5FI_18105, partial [Anaerolineales bacterium]
RRTYPPETALLSLSPGMAQETWLVVERIRRGDHRRSRSGTGCNKRGGHSGPDRGAWDHHINLPEYRDSRA